MTVMQAAVDTGHRLALFRARMELVRKLKERFGGRGLDVREGEKKMVIRLPGHPELGSVHCILATGEVSHRRTVWKYLGYLPGYGSGDPDQPGVDVDAIAAIFTPPAAAPGPVPESEGDS